MDVIKTQQISSRPIEKVIVHPLVLLSIVDNYNRVAKDTRKRVVGVLLGSSFKGTVDVSNSYAGSYEISLALSVFWKFISRSDAFRVSLSRKRCQLGAISYLGFHTRVWLRLGFSIQNCTQFLTDSNQLFLWLGVSIMMFGSSVLAYIDVNARKSCYFYLSNT